MVIGRCSFAAADVTSAVHVKLIRFQRNVDVNTLLMAAYMRVAF